MNEQPRSIYRRILKRVLLGVLVIVVVLTLAVVVIATSLDGPTGLLQKFVYWQRGTDANSFEPATPVRDIVRQDGLRVLSNVRYGRRYPNSFMDIWYPDARNRVKRPTVLYMHGGGFFMGSKDWGDPLAGGAGASGAVDMQPGTVAAMAKAGFNVVNLDYALAPAYRYPVPLVQLNQAISYLRLNAQRLGLDMSRVFIMGGSAGAQMSAQYGLLVSDHSYARQVGITPAIDRSAIKGLVLFSAPLKVSGFGWRFNAMLGSYLGSKDLEEGPKVRQLDILAQVNERYPPTYITDGNQPDTFPEHAKAMARALEEKRVDHVFNYYEPRVAKLDHGYTGRLDTKWGRENLDRAINFMKNRAATPLQPEEARKTVGLHARGGRHG